MMRDHPVMDGDERGRLIDRLAGEFDLAQVAADACARNGVPERGDQVAYCLVVQAMKDGLDPDDPEFRRLLASRAAETAVNLRDWGAAYEDIQDEADRYELETLRSLSRARTSDDVVTRVADELAAILAGSPRLDEMSLPYLREAAPAGNQYVFQSPLPGWVTLAIKRRTPWDADPLDEHAHEPGKWDAPDEIETATRVRELALRALVERVAALARSRGLLAAAIDRANALEGGLAEQAPPSREDLAALTQVRAEIVHVLDGLRNEQRRLPGMLAYVVLALRNARNLQRVSILSLREESIDRLVVDHMASTMRAIVVDEMEPKPALIASTRQAAERRAVPRARVKALEEVRAAPTRRGSLLAPVVRRLDELPAAVADLAAIAACEATTTRIVAVNRSSAAAELTAVDQWFGRVFKRYAMGIT